MMKVTIGIPVYGVERYVERCARSLFAQTYEDIEFLFIDDCSPDRSIEIICTILKEYPNREHQVRVFRHKKNKGLAAARNTAVELATGKFILWVDSDDYIEKDAVEKLVYRQRETNCDICTFNYIVHRCNSEYVKKDSPFATSRQHTKAVLRREASVAIWNKFIRTSLYKENMIVAEEGINMGEDFQVSPRLLYYAKSTSHLDTALYHYDKTGATSITKRFTVEMNRQMWRAYDIIEEFFRDKDDDFVDALNISKLWIVVQNLIISTKCPKTAKGIFYQDAMARLLEIDRKYWKYQPVFKRIILCICTYQKLMDIYVSLCRAINGKYYKF